MGASSGVHITGGSVNAAGGGGSYTTYVEDTGTNNSYLNSSEIGCTRSGTPDSDVILCDDFEDGDYYLNDCDNSGGDPWLSSDGWCGTIYNNPITPTGAGICSSAGAVGTDCAGHRGTLSGSTTGNMAIHQFRNGPVTELWARWYYKANAGYMWGGEKHTNTTKLAGDITWWNIQFNCGTGGQSSSATPYVQVIHGSDFCQSVKTVPGGGSTYSIASGKWYYIEQHTILNSSGTTADGTIEIWIDDCGADGLGCTGSPTLRYQNTAVAFDRNQAGCSTSPCKIEALWFENWANPVSTGTSYLDQIRVQTTGPIGFFDGTN